MNVDNSRAALRPPPDAWQLLKDRFTPERQQRMESVAAARTQAIRLVVQDIHNPHNVSACMRSAEAFGVQQIDVVCLKEKFSPSTVARGVAGWLSIRKWDRIEDCAQNIKDSGYRLAAALPSPHAKPLQEIDLSSGPLAVVFGNEHEGVHGTWQKYVDFSFTIPMVGFVESLNISVSAALALHYLTMAAKKAMPESLYYLSSADQQQLLSEWSCSQLRDWPTELEKRRKL